jgi:hypothetical protein
MVRVLGVSYWRYTRAGCHPGYSRRLDQVGSVTCVHVLCEKVYNYLEVIPTVTGEAGSTPEGTQFLI